MYRWKDPSHAIKDASKEELHSLPKIKTKWTKKIRPGISTFGEKPAQVGADHLKELIDYALQVVPEDMVADTPIYLMATAGMRFLPQLQQTALLRETCSYLSQHTSFYLPDCSQNIQVISGETEGLYGWLAANYLLGGFDRPEEHEHGQNHHTYGFLDMGGASAQIAFAPNSTEAAEHADNLKLIRLRTLDGNPSEHRIFTATWLGFGVNKARESYVKSLIAIHKDLVISGSDVPDPCMPKGLRTTLDGALAAKERVPTLVGTGDFANCLVSTKPLLAKDTTCGEGAEPCLIHDPVPSIDFNVNHFVGVSEYYHSTHGFFGEKGDLAYDFVTYQKKVIDFCDQDWTSIGAKIEGISGRKKNKAGDKDVERTLQDAQQACFKASWVINVLHEGIGIPRVGLDKIPGLNASGDGAGEKQSQGTSYSTPFRPVDKIEDVEVSWTLGRMLLYAAGQVPPRGVSSSGNGNGNGITAGKGVAVGFGSNSKDGAIPSDFTYAGSSWEPLKIGSGKVHDNDNDNDNNDDWTDAADDLFDKARDKSAIPGALFFLLLVLLFAFLLRKKERRVRLYSKFGSFLRRSRWPGSPRKPGRFTSTIGGGTHNGSSSGPLAGLAKMLFRRHSRDYDRVLEEGQMDQFELGDVDALDDDFISDSSEGSGSSGVRMGLGGGGTARRPGGLSTPSMSVDRFDDLRPPAASLSAMDRSGLVVRTESRERLGMGGLGAPSLQMLNAGRRSRATSPTRLKTPMASLQED